MNWNGSNEDSRKESWQNQPPIHTTGLKPGAFYLGAAPTPGGVCAEDQPPAGLKFDFCRLISLREKHEGPDRVWHLP